MNQENTKDKKLRGRTIDFTQTLRSLSLGESPRSALTSSMPSSICTRVKQLHRIDDNNRKNKEYRCGLNLEQPWNITWNLKRNTSKTADKMCQLGLIKKNPLSVTRVLKVRYKERM